MAGTLVKRGYNIIVVRCLFDSCMLYSYGTHFFLVASSNTHCYKCPVWSSTRRDGITYCTDSMVEPTVSLIIHEKSHVQTLVKHPLKLRLELYGLHAALATASWC